jgi:hypothetical protein
MHVPAAGLRRVRRLVLVVALAVSTAGIAACGGGGGGSTAPARSPIESVSIDTPADVSFTIPAGAAERTAAGENVQVFPNPLVLHVGQVIRIRNDDRIGYDIGPFYVGPGQTTSRRVTGEGDFTSFCNLHPTGRVTVQIVT